MGNAPAGLAVDLARQARIVAGLGIQYVLRSVAFRLAPVGQVEPRGQFVGVIRKARGVLFSIRPLAGGPPELDLQSQQLRQEPAPTVSGNLPQQLLDRRLLARPPSQLEPVAQRVDPPLVRQSTWVVRHPIDSQF